MNTQQTEVATQKTKAPKKSTIQHMLNDAFDGPAVVYWAGARSIVRATNGDVVSFVVYDGAPDGEPVSKATKTINQRSLLAARDRIVNEDVGIHRTIAAQFVGPMEVWEYDRDGIDALIQIALFGKIVYG